jgi:hypothetical protein
MNEEHPSHELLDRLRRGGASRDEVLAVTKHLTRCADCRTAARSRIDVPAAADALREQIAGHGHPDLERELFAYADGARRDPAVTAHLTECARCRQDVEDLRLTVRRPVRRPYRAAWLVFATAAAIAAVIIGTLLMPERAPEVPAFRPPVAVVKPNAPTPLPSLPDPEPVHVRTMRPEWAELVERARGGEAPAMPSVLRKLRRSADVLRGSATARALLAPAGIVVESQRPRFTWDIAGGERFEVWLFAEGREVARSGSIKEKAWTPQRPLRRGVTYTWEVQVERNSGETEVHPMPPAPPAEVHVLDAKTQEEIEEARREHAADHLLLALLYARAGLVAEARAELGQVTSEKDVEAARRLRDDLDTWSIVPS